MGELSKRFFWTGRASYIKQTYASTTFLFMIDPLQGDESVSSFFTPVHIHLLLTHVPIVGVAFVTALLLIGIIFRNTFTQRVSLLFLVFCAAVTVVVYQTGDGAADVAKNLPDVSQSMIHTHEDIARISSFILWAIGGIALLGLFFFRKRDKFPHYFIVGVLTLSIIATCFFAYTGYLGGLIRHSEVRPTSHIVIPAHQTAYAPVVVRLE
jgi:uncharacterized membrane protein